MRDDPLETRRGIRGVITNTMPSDELTELKLAFADALWKWAEVETQVFAVYICTVATLQTDIRPIRAAFFAINSFEMRLTMTDAAVKQRWPKAKSLLADWRTLRERCHDASRQRGRIAHRAGNVRWPDKPHQKPFVALHEPTMHADSPKNYGIAKSTGIDTGMLRQFCGTWSKLNSDLNLFAYRVTQEALPL
jgi:hypothetical protein